MAKYWKLITITTVIVFSIAAYYTQAALATKGYPQFSIKSIEGNEDVIDSLVISADYKWHYVGEPLRIDKTGSHYWRDESYLTQLKSYYQPIETEVLQDEYKSFMRGREKWEGYIENGDTYVAYANIPYTYYGSALQKFDLAVLNKDTKETVAFEHPIPNLGDYYYFNVLNVQYTDDKLLVITENGKEGEMIELHLYTFDMNEQVLISDDVIQSFAYKEMEYGYESIEVIPSEEEGNYSVAITFQTYKHLNRPNDYGAHEVVEHEIVIYDPLSKSSQLIKGIKADERIGSVVAYNNGNLFFKQYSVNGSFSIAKYNVENEVHEDDFITFPAVFNEPFSLEEITVKVHEGNLYGITPYTDKTANAYIVASDIETGELGYYGEITPEKVDALDKAAVLYIQDFGWK
ncbi:hypothetical protein ACLIBH_00985 [Virgibacillus sp. W0430]|uniref:hypothetical protein n=1 Tax=Virgibacillus sp. W0430 TaxID=3391580 RepID=UPI003F46652C